MSATLPLPTVRSSTTATKLLRSAGVLLATGAFITAAMATSDDTGAVFCHTPDSCAVMDL